MSEAKFALLPFFSYFYGDVHITKNTAMELLHYFDHRFNKATTRTPNALPFITISRETGCGASQIARMLVRELKARGTNWKYVDKEILNESAEKLKIDPSKIKLVFNAVQKTHADEILMALSTRYYKSDGKVRKVIEDVVTHMASEGNVVLIGRGGVSITSELKNAIHVRLTAPRNWRIDTLSQRKKRSLEDIETFIDGNDKMRKRMITVFKKDILSDNQFDIEINCARFTKRQIVEIIMKVVEIREYV